MNAHATIVVPTIEPLDIHVGARIRLLRKERGISQTALAEAVGLTFQQIQKYERGFNRVSASRLHQIAGALEVPLAIFFEGLPTAGAPGDPLGDQELTTALQDGRIRRLVREAARLSPLQLDAVLGFAAVMTTDGGQ